MFCYVLIFVTTRRISENCTINMHTFPSSLSYPKSIFFRGTSIVDVLSHKLSYEKPIACKGRLRLHRITKNRYRQY